MNKTNYIGTVFEGKKKKTLIEQAIPIIHCDRCYESAQNTARLIFKKLEKQDLVKEYCISGYFTENPKYKELKKECGIND